MNPINSNEHPRPGKGCTPVSSSCVIWTGPDIPCINICRGDAIDKVVYDLALLLCQVSEGVIDITTLDFKCLVEQNGPTELIAILQLLIDKHCELETTVAGIETGNGGTSTPDTPITLPDCLHYTNADGDLVTSLPSREYSILLAERICGILVTLASLTNNYTSLVNRVETLEDFIANLNTNTSIPTIVSKCLTGVTEGLDIPITDAVETMETFLCQLIDTLGSLSELSTLIDTECPDLDNSLSLSVADTVMSDISGWTTNPTNVSQNLVNLWLTLCDMRTAVSSLLEPPAPPCAPVAPSNVQITNLTNSGCTITWNPPSIAGTENPIGYNVTVFEWNGSTEVGPAVVDQPVPFGTNTITISAGDPTKYYKVAVTAVYDTCGTSIASVIYGMIVLSTYVAKLTYSEVVSADSPIVPCLGTDYPTIQKTGTFTLISLLTGAPIVNTGLPLTIVASFNKTNDCMSGDYDVVITIPTGQSFGNVKFFAEKTISCAPDTCNVEYRSINCVQTISNPNVIMDGSLSMC